MLKKLFSTQAFWQENILAILRILLGIFLVIHGKEVFEAERMNDYVQWDAFKSSAWLPYLGKGAEFVAGIMLLFGFLTRLACIITIGTFLYIIFFVGNGKFWMDDQHPFMFVLFALLFLFTGPVKWSLDQLIFKNNNE